MRPEPLDLCFLCFSQLDSHEIYSRLATCTLLEFIFLYSNPVIPKMKRALVFCLRLKKE